MRHGVKLVSFNAIQAWLERPLLTVHDVSEPERIDRRIWRSRHFNEKIVAQGCDVGFEAT